MSKHPEQLSDQTKQWIEAIRSGKLTMSQRKVATLVKADGGLEPAIAEAKKQSVHLLRLTDDQGNDLIAAAATLLKHCAEYFLT